MMVSHHRILAVLAIVASGCIFSFSVSEKLPRYIHNLLTTHEDAIPSSHRRLMHMNADVYRDPKTVQLKPKLNNYAQSDATSSVGNIRRRQPVVAANLHNVTSPTTNIGGGDSSLPPYSFDSALLSTRAFRYTLFFFVYDSRSDKFYIIHNVHQCDFGCKPIFQIGRVVSYALRKNFPERFRGAAGVSDDLVFMVATGDAPRIKQKCMFEDDHCRSADYAPILNFGSVFVYSQILPSMIAMPMPVRPHIHCFEEWLLLGKHGMCKDLQPKKESTDGRVSGLIFGKEMGLLDDENYWDNLIPQIIWRGTDFVFLHTMFPEMRSPTYELDIKPHEATRPKNAGTRRWAIDTLWEMGDEKLLPRWRGVLLTSEAELEAGDNLPWVNIKFANVHLNGQKTSAVKSEELQQLQRLGISAIGERINMVEQAKYRYHIDLGGGGGTTWTGTIEKLSLPGVLFHHVTPTKDWFHDLLVPWTHYIPVKTDLSDLREKYDWAESHPVEARRIAEAGTEFARWMGSVEGFERLYEEHFITPLRDVINAYQPMPEKYNGKSALEIINAIDEARKGKDSRFSFSVIARCSGLTIDSCEKHITRGADGKFLGEE